MNPYNALAIFFIVIAFGPLIYLVWAGKKRGRKMKNALTLLAQQHQCDIDELDTWSDKAIGIDKGVKLLFFLNDRRENKKDQIVDLNKAIKCRIYIDADTTNLLIDSKFQKGISSVHLKFYNSKFDDPVEAGYHRELAKKWCAVIEHLIALKPAPRLKSA